MTMRDLLAKLMVSLCNVRRLQVMKFVLYGVLILETGNNACIIKTDAHAEQFYEEVIPRRRVSPAVSKCQARCDVSTSHQTLQRFLLKASQRSRRQDTVDMYVFQTLSGDKKWKQCQLKELSTSENIGSPSPILNLSKRKMSDCDQTPHSGLFSFFLLVFH